MLQRAILMLLLGFTVSLSQDNPVDVTLKIYRVIDGQRYESTRASPGDTVEYVLTGTNIGNTTLPAGTVVLTGPIPDSTTIQTNCDISRTDFFVEYSLDNSTFLKADNFPENSKALRWTYLKALESGQSIEVIYCVKVNGNPSTVSRETSFDLKTINAFTQAIFGHLGVIQIDCPSEFNGVSEQITCGVGKGKFDLFQSQWDLYSEWENKVPIIPTPLSAWKFDGNSFNRSYSFGETVYIVTVVESGEDNLLILTLIQP